MKRMLLAMMAAWMVSSVALADGINVHTDSNAVNGSCNLSNGFTQTATVMYFGWTPGGSTGARFKVVAPAGSTIFSITTPYVTIGNVTTDLSIAFGGCVEGTFPLGTLTANWAPGTGSVAPSDGQLTIQMADCSFVEHQATGGTFCVAQTGGGCDCHEWPCPSCPPVATQPSTWGQVKGLYR